MKMIKFAFRRLLSKGDHNITRIISLVAGLSFGVILLSEVFYYKSYDSFYPDADRTYIIQQKFKVNTDENWKFSSEVSGAVAPGMLTEVPGVEAATRINQIGNSVFYTEDKKSYSGKVILADEHVFDVFPRKLIEGDPGEILKTPMHCMVSDEIAGEIGGDVIGRSIELKEYPGKKYIISGIFEKLPENTNKSYDILVSMASTKEFMWDGTDNWMGNDRYYSCVRLQEGVSPESLAPAIRQMQEKHQDITAMEKKHGFLINYTLKPILEHHTEKMGDMIIILSTVALAVLFVSIMNYILLTLSALIKRAKSSAIHKTCGAQEIHLHKMIFSESAFLFIISAVISFLFIFLFKSLIESQFHHKLDSSLHVEVIVPVVLTLLVIVLFIGFLPGYFFSKIPVSAAFHGYRQKKDKWKLGLLAFQFIGASFILTVLVVVSMQYSKMVNADHGYQTHQIYYGSTSGFEGSKLTAVIEELRSMPEIESVGLGYSVPTQTTGGNNIYSQDGLRELINVADFYEIDENYLPILNIPVVQGQNFAPGSASANDILISQKCADLLVLNNKWDDGVVGKQIKISQHGTTTIRGVYPDFIMNTIANPDNRASVFLYKPETDFISMKKQDPSARFNILMKVNKDHEKGIMKEIAHVFNMALPYKDAVINSLESDLEANYKDVNGFRVAMMSGNVVILLITIIGLIGYTTNESVRRSKELAIRKINGARFSDILTMFLKDLQLIAVPAVLFGILPAWFIINRWMENFASKIQLHWGIFALSSLLILVVVVMTASINYARLANKNPVEALRYE